MALTASKGGESPESRSEQLKSKLIILTDEDLNFEAGKSDEMFENLQAKLGKSKEELATIISGLYGHGFW